MGGRGGGAVGLGPAVGRRVLLKNPGWGWRGAGGAVLWGWAPFIPILLLFSGCVVAFVAFVDLLHLLRRRCCCCCWWWWWW